jgi:hypothetical protein
MSIRSLAFNWREAEPPVAKRFEMAMNLKTGKAPRHAVPRRFCFAPTK